MLRKLTVHGFQEPQQNMEVMVSVMLFQLWVSYFEKADIFLVGVLSWKWVQVCKMWMAMKIESALSLVSGSKSQESSELFSHSQYEESPAP